jgi:hypothetical protein
MINTPITDNKRLPSFRIPRCGKFPNYQLNKVFFHEKNLIYLVSVGKDKFENKWVERFVNFIKKVKPYKTIVVVADTLQRFNIEIDESLDSKRALNESIYKGQIWALKYEKFFSGLKKLNINYEFVHWEALKKDSDFEKYLLEIKKLSEENETFKKALLISSQEYSHRASRVNSDTSDETAQKNSRQFLIEECAVFQVLAKDKDNLAIVYPGAVTEVLAYSIRHINEHYREKIHTFYWLELKRTKNSKKEEIEPKLEESTKIQLFRNISLNEVKLPSYQVGQDLNCKAFFFRRPSLISYPSGEKPSKFLRV